MVAHAPRRRPKAFTTSRLSAVGGPSCPPIDRSLLELYFAYYVKTGYLPSQQEQHKIALQQLAAASAAASVPATHATTSASSPATAVFDTTAEAKELEGEKW